MAGREKRIPCLNTQKNSRRNVMLTTKLIRKTFGAKIESYGFQYKGNITPYMLLCIETGDRIQEIELQKDPGSIQLIFTFPLWYA